MRHTHRERDQRRKSRGERREGERTEENRYIDREKNGKQKNRMTHDRETRDQREGSRPTRERIIERFIGQHILQETGERETQGEGEDSGRGELEGAVRPTQHLHGLFVVLVSERGAYRRLAASPPPQLPADEAVEHSEAENRQEEEDAGHPHHDGEQSGAHGELGRSALVGVPRVGAILMLHSDQHEDGPGAAESHGPDDQDDELHPALGDHHLGPQREADGEVALDAQRGDGEHRSVGAALTDKLEEFAEQVAQVPGPVMPEAHEVEGHAEEDE